MCCCRINTDVLMANFFAKLEDNRAITLNDLQSYLDFLSEEFFVYVYSDFCAEKVKECAEEYSELYQIKKLGEEFVIERGSLTPNLKYFNAIYSEAVSSHIERMTSYFFSMNTG